MKSVLKKIGPLLGLILFGIALWYLNHELRHYDLHDVARHLSTLPEYKIFLAFLFTALSYTALTLYDTLGFYYIKKPMAYRKIAKAGFIGYAFSNNIGFSIITGGSVRYRLYSAWGLSGIEITEIVAFCGLTLWTGFLMIGGLAFTLAPPILPDTLSIPFASVRLVGILFLTGIFGYITASFLIKNSLKIREWEISFPKPKITLSQVLISSFDWTIAGAVLYVLLPSSNLTFIAFIGVFLLAQISGVISQVPGGLGVFESVMILFLSPHLHATSVLSALIAFRGIYYIVPLILASLVLGYQEIVNVQPRVGKFTRTITGWIPRIAPQILSFTIFIGGAILLFSGATPGEIPRLRWLRHFVPLPIIELSHFLGSMVGAALLILARGLQRRLDAAYHMTVGLLMAGIVFSLLKGFDYEEAIIMAIMLAALIPSREAFYRKASLFGQKFTIGWIAAIALILISSTWLGFFAYRHVEYSEDLWWRFTLLGNAPRYLRATVGAIGLTIIFGFLKLMRTSKIKPVPPNNEEIESAKQIIEQSPYTESNLALTRDKTLLFNEQKTSFLMYSVEGKSWVALGDPIGKSEDMPELIWQFREFCDEHDAWSVFYQVREQYLSLYLDLGLTLLKLGEEARVPLSNFSMEGGSRKAMRYQHKKLQRDGFSFQMISREEAWEHMDEFKSISDSWLKEKNTKEKGFSLGFFNKDYLENFPFAIIKLDDKIVAFANIWNSFGKHELSLDLMRKLPDVPNGIMDFIFIELMLWGQQEGYEWFNLGMAPLSGLENHELAPLWNKLASLIYTHGEHFYNFQGLRQYKNKFDPVWKPKYLACPGGIALPRVLTNVTTLISGGIKGVITK